MDLILDIVRSISLAEVVNRPIATVLTMIAVSTLLLINTDVIGEAVVKNTNSPAENMDMHYELQVHVYLTYTMIGSLSLLYCYL